MPRFSLRTFAFPILTLLSACARPEAAPADQAAEVESPIIGGSLDSTHPAVVAVLGNTFACSGTIIKVANGQGYVLTAAHCCVPGDLPSWVVIGQDYNSGQVFDIVPGSVKSDPCYQDCAGSTDDVCMLRFSGASGSTPVIPAMTTATDSLAVGTPITYVGYGLTASPPNGNNSKRRVVQKTIGSLDPYFVEYANPASSGTCEGDSGGPGLVVVNGSEQVAAVTSFGDQACTQLGASIRVSKVYDGFIAPYLAGQSASPTCPVDTDCNICAQISETSQCGGDCATKTNACFNDPACSALINCYQGCTTVACQYDCNTKYVNGLQKYEAIESCLCTGSCATACHSQLCLTNKCGMKPKGATATCATCAEDKCCAAEWTCSQNLDCKKCFSNTVPDPACATNKAALDYYACVTSNCASAGCVLNDPMSGASSSSSSSSTSSSTSGAAGGGGSPGAGGGSPAGAGGGSTSSSGTGGSTPMQHSGCATSPVREGSSALPLVGLAAAAMLARRRRRAG